MRPHAARIAEHQPLAAAQHVVRGDVDDLAVLQKSLPTEQARREMPREARGSPRPEVGVGVVSDLEGKAFFGKKIGLSEASFIQLAERAAHQAVSLLRPGRADRAEPALRLLAQIDGEALFGDLRMTRDEVSQLLRRRFAQLSIHFSPALRAYHMVII